MICQETKPIVKWAGGKSQLLPYILPMVPSFKTYYEPFLGGGALYFALQPNNAVLNDFNEQLINMYVQTRDNYSSLKRQLNKLQKEHNDSTEHYNELRAEFNKYLSKNTKSLRSAALFIYLNKAGYNGLYRLNSKGLFNTPSGKRKKVSLYDDNNLLAVSELLESATLLNGDFEDGLKRCKRGDFVFFDSPYYNTFDTYQAGGFSVEDHIRLANTYKRLSSKGVKCLLTNSDELFIKKLYCEFNIKTVDVKRMINCDGKNRVGKEIIVTNYE